ncbi:hypothetical protein QL285_017006 [Trifolium repens]|nr:hypothetical protein QL285_017006 [Trifolium repens]
MLDSSSKRSRELFSFKSFSSVNPNPNLYRQVMDQLRKLFGNGLGKRLTKAYRDASELHYVIVAPQMVRPTTWNSCSLLLPLRSSIHLLD